MMQVGTLFVPFYSASVSPTAEPTFRSSSSAETPNSLARASRLEVLGSESPRSHLETA